MCAMYKLLYTYNMAEVCMNRMKMCERAYSFKHGIQQSFTEKLNRSFLCDWLSLVHLIFFFNSFHFIFTFSGLHITYLLYDAILHIDISNVHWLVWLFLLQLIYTLIYLFNKEREQTKKK